MKTRVTGLGGVFFKTKDTKKTARWYKRHLGLPIETWGGASFNWRDAKNPKKKGATLWSPFPGDTEYFGAGKQAHMVNYRVANLKKLLAQLKKEGVWIDPRSGEDSEFGKFGWIKDLDGNRVELWEPPVG